jgi:hypothetical protein
LIVSLVATSYSSAVHAQDEEVTISMSNYEDLLNRMDSIESREAAPQWSSSRPRHCSNGACGAEGGYFSSYELVLLNPVYSNSTAFYTHDTAPAVPENATLTEFDWDMEVSHRLELGYLSPSTNLGWRARYWFFDSNTSVNSVADASVKVGVADDPDIALDTISATDPDFLQAFASTEIDAVDLEFVSKRFIYHNLVTFGAGLRYADIQHNYQGLDVDPTLAGPNNVQAALRTDFNFEGIGPTISLASRRRIGGTDFGWNVEGRTSILFGQGDALWQRLDDGGVAGNPLAIKDAIVHNNETRVLPVTELRMGIDYRSYHGQTRYDFGMGLETQVWFNGGTPLEAGQDGATDSDGITSPWTEDLGFIGMYFRGGVTY